MKKMVLGLAVGAALAPGFVGEASAQSGKPPSALGLAALVLSGDVSMYGGVAGSEGETFGIFGGEGRFAWGLSNAWVLQGDVHGNSTFVSGGFGLTNFGLTGHLYDRTMGSAFGVKVGPSVLFGDEVGIMGGLEGQVFLGALTLGAEVNDTWFTGFSEGLLQIRGLARFYPSPNTRFQLDASWWGWSNGGPNDIWALAGSVVHRLPMSPVNLTAGVRYDSFGGSTAISGTVGVGLNFDGPGTSQAAHDRTVVFDTFQIDDFEGFMVSDVRLKTDIALLDHLPNGLGLYRYRYLWSDTVYVGVMAQEVAEAIPQAVKIGADGYLRVNYALLGTHLMTWEEWTQSHPDQFGFTQTAWQNSATASAPAAQ